VRKILSAQIQGEEGDQGTSTIQATFSLGPNLSGSFAVSETPDAFDRGTPARPRAGPLEPKMRGQKREPMPAVSASYIKRISPPWYGPDLKMDSTGPVKNKSGVPKECQVLDQVVAAAVKRWHFVTLPRDRPPLHSGGYD